MRAAGALLVALLLALVGCGERPAPPELPPIGGMPADLFYIERDLFLPADDPRTVPADAAPFLREDDEVLGVVVGGHARAYPVPMIAYHHVVNDVIEGIPVAVTY